MGIRDRDYMKRPSDEGEERHLSSEGKLEALFNGFFRRHPRLLLVICVIMAVAILAAVIVAKISSGGR
jgi:hypothetical protein